MGLDIYLEWEGKTEADQAKQYRGFQNGGDVGYLRSAYNEYGFNIWCNRNLGKRGFYYIFDYEEERCDEEGRFFPDWLAAERKTLELITMLDALPDDRLEIVEVPSGFQHQELTDQNVLDYYRKHAKPADPFECYSNWAGLWFSGKPASVKAVLWIKNLMPMFGGPLKPVLVVESEEDPHKYYRDTLRHTIEFINRGKECHGWLTWSS